MMRLRFAHLNPHRLMQRTISFAVLVFVAASVRLLAADCFAQLMAARNLKWNWECDWSFLNECFRPIRRSAGNSNERDRNINRVGFHDDERGGILPAAPGLAVRMWEDDWKSHRESFLNVSSADKMHSSTLNHSCSPAEIRAFDLRILAQRGAVVLQSDSSGFENVAVI